MGKHEIRLRKQRITARGSERFRNYGSVLKQHEEEKKIKTIIKIFTYLFITAALILIFIVVTRWEDKKTAHNATIKIGKVVNLKKQIDSYKSTFEFHDSENRKI